MSFSGSSYNLWTDANLTSAFSGTFNVTNKTDLSDNPQDFVLYFGSPFSDRLLQAASNPGVAQITLTQTDILPEWIASNGYLVGDKVQPISGNGFVYVCTVAGVSGLSQPSWPVVTIGTTVVDNTCTWALVGAHHAITEIKLALSSGALAGATGGVAMNVATTISGGIAGAIPIYIRLTNAVTTAANNTGHEEIGVFLNACVETATS